MTPAVAAPYSPTPDGETVQTVETVEAPDGEDSSDSDTLTPAVAAPYSPNPDGEDSPLPLPSPIVEASLIPLEAFAESVDDEVVDEPITDQERLVDFFETATAEDIESIKGIGQTTAQELINERPLTWAKADAILSQRQIDSAIAHLKQ